MFRLWCLLAGCMLVGVLSATFGVTPALADKRVALVIGNSGYKSVPPLDNPKNDATVMAETLRGLGFELVGGGPQLDLDKAAIDRAVQRFGDELLGADVGLFYYAGHGLQVRGANYLVPVDANPTHESDVDFQMLDANAVLRQMQDAGSKLNLVILDACRNNPFGGRGLRAFDRGLAIMQAPEGTLISFATQPGDVARDGTDGNSPYTKALAQTMARPGLDVFQLFNAVGVAVMQATANTQKPWLSASPIKGDFYFMKVPATLATPMPAPAPAAPVDPAAQEWAAIKDTTSEALLEAFIEQFRDSFYSNLAQARLEDLRRSHVVAAPSVPVDQPAPSRTFTGNYQVKSNVSQGILNMRSGPGQGHSIVIAIPAGATGVKLGQCRAPDDDRSKFDWCSAQWNGNVGWISSNGVVRVGN